MPVVLSADAVVEPVAMVIKFFDTFIAISAMLTAFLDVHLTYLTIKLILRLILKNHVQSITFFLYRYYAVFWVDLGGPHHMINYEHNRHSAYNTA